MNPQVTNNAREFVRHASMFDGAATLEFVALRIVDLHPYSGPTDGGTAITLVGHGFQVGDLACRFGTASAVPAHRLSNYRITCLSPRYPVTGWVGVEVQSFNSTAESASAFFFQASLTQSDANSLLSQSGGENQDTLLESNGASAFSAPASGPIKGGTIISITGNNFLNTESLSCRFGAALYTVVARYLTSRTLECVTPVHPAGLVAVKLSLNGQQFADVGATYLFHELPVVASITPYRGSIQGSSRVLIEGGRYITSGSISTCRFGSVTVPATVLSDTSLVCITPTNPPGYVAVEVSNNLQDYSTSGVLYMYHLVSVDSVLPHFVSQLGGTNVQVRGSGFMPPYEGALYCIIGTMSPVIAHWESKNLISCEVQTSRQDGPVPVSVRSNDTLYLSTATLLFTRRPFVHALEPVRGPVRGGTQVILRGYDFSTAVTDRCFFGSIIVVPRLRSDNTYECFSPPAPTNCTVQVTINQDTTAEPVFFRYFDEPIITAVKPLRGPADGGTYVEVSGYGFDMASALLGQIQCRFNRTTVPATAVSSALLQCVSPKHAEGYVDVEVTMQLQDYTSSGVQFQYQVSARM